MFGKKPLTLYRHPGLYLEQVQDKGRGVFCLQDIKKDELLEVAPLLIFPNQENFHISQTLLADYVFNADKLPAKFMKSIGIDDPEKTACLPMGITSICNHMVEPNASYRFEVDDLSPFAILTATRDIAKGDEISVSYGGAWFMSRKNSR